MCACMCAGVCGILNVCCHQSMLHLHVIPKMTEVRAILNWKYEKNGDPLIDVASLLLAFLDLGSYNVSVPPSLVYHGKHSTHRLKLRHTSSKPRTSDALNAC